MKTILKENQEKKAKGLIELMGVYSKTDNWDMQIYLLFLLFYLQVSNKVVYLWCAKIKN